MNNSNNHISDELLAAFLDGNVSPEEAASIMQTAAHDPELREVIELSGIIDTDLFIHRSTSLPMMETAAYTHDDCACAIECETHILQQLGSQTSAARMRHMAQSLGLLKETGMQLFNIGRLAETEGMSVSRIYGSAIHDLAENTLAVVDCGSLNGDASNDVLHAVVIKSISEKDNTVTLFDPQHTDTMSIMDLDQFVTAWSGSNNYLVSINHKGTGQYIPHPIDLSDIELEDKLTELREAIAENAHEVWAANRQAQGWSYGPKRDDDKKETPDMIPYSDLPESEKLYDREMAINTLKLVQKLGYEVFKKAEVDREQHQLSLFVKRTLLRTDTPDARQIAALLFDKVMMNGATSFQTLSKLLERQTGILIGTYLNPDILIKNGVPVNSIPEQLTPDVVNVIGSGLHQFHSSSTVSETVTQIYETLMDAIESTGWHFGIMNLPEGIDVLRKKLQQHIDMYDQSTPQSPAALTDLQPLFDAASRITLSEHIRQNNHEDIQTLFNAMCNNALNLCSNLNHIFIQRTISDIISSDRLEAIRKKNIQFRDNCLQLTSCTDIPSAPKRFFTDPDIISPTCLNL